MLERRFTGLKPSSVLPPGAIDSHIHLFLDGYPAQPGGPPLPQNPPGPADYRQVMDRLGIERVVVVQGNAHQFDNACLLACLSEMGGSARGVAAISGETPDAEMQRLHDAGVRGARIMDLPGGAAGLDRLAEIDARTHAFGWSLAVQFDGSDILEHLPALEKIRSRYTLDHHGKFLTRAAAPDGPEVAAIKRLIARGNCWFKLAACYESSKSGPPAYADVAAVSREIAGFAPERLVWGSNWPHNMITRTEDYPDDATLLDLVLGWLPDDTTLRRTLVDNPRDLFDFS